MRKRAIALIVIGILFSLLAGIGSFRHSRALEAELSSAKASLLALGDTVAIPVPLRDAERGAALKAEDFTMLHLPVNALPDNMLTELPALKEGEALVALRAVKRKAMIPEGALVLPGATPDQGITPTAGGQAFLVDAKNIDSLLPQLKIGARVDLVWTRSIGGGVSETRLIGSDLTILALPDPGATGPAGQILLEGLPQTALTQVAASPNGQFDLLLSGGKIDAASGKFVIGAAELKQLPLLEANLPPAVVQPEYSTTIETTSVPAERCTTALIRGGNRVMMEVPC